MGKLEDIFNQYVHMRHNGVSAKNALRALRNYVETLPPAQRQTLSQQIQAWEGRGKQSKRQSSAAKKPKKAPSATVNDIPDPPLEAIMRPVVVPVSQQPTQETIEWVACSNCKSKNRKSEIFCHRCGQILEGITSKHDTQTFKSGTDDLYRDDYFGDDSVMRLVVRNAQMAFDLRPQRSKNEIIIGRSSGDSTMKPDVDLQEFGAEKSGVSRLHLSVDYDAEKNTLKLMDYGSANGTFLNGQRLRPDEQRIVRNGDELRLGRLTLKVIFLHPGEAIER